MNTLKLYLPEILFFVATIIIILVVCGRHDYLGYWAIGGELLLLPAWFVYYMYERMGDDE